MKRYLLFKRENLIKELNLTKNHQNINININCINELEIAIKSISKIMDKNLGYFSRILAFFKF